MIIGVDGMAGADSPRANNGDVTNIDPEYLMSMPKFFAVLCIKMMKSPLFDVVRRCVLIMLTWFV